MNKSFIKKKTNALEMPSKFRDMTPEEMDYGGGTDWNDYFSNMLDNTLTDVKNGVMYGGGAGAIVHIFTNKHSFGGLIQPKNLKFFSWGYWKNMGKWSGIGAGGGALMGV